MQQFYNQSKWGFENVTDTHAVISKWFYGSALGLNSKSCEWRYLLKDGVKICPLTTVSSINLLAYPSPSVYISNSRNFRVTTNQSGYVNCCSCRSSFAKRVQVPVLGNPAHTVGDIQLPASPHPAPLPNPAFVATAQPCRGTANKPHPNTLVVSRLFCNHSID